MCCMCEVWVCIWYVYYVFGIGHSGFVCVYVGVFNMDVYNNYNIVGVLWIICLCKVYVLGVCVLRDIQLLCFFFVRGRKYLWVFG